MHPKGSDTRTDASAASPIAARTWLGIRESEVQAEPLATLMPRRSSSSTTVSPVTPVQVNVTMCGSRSTGSPTTSTPSSRGSWLRMSAVRPRRRSASASTCGARYSSAVAAAAAPGMSGKPFTQPRSGFSSGVQRTDGPHHEDADPGGTAPVAGGGGQHVPVGGHGPATDDLDGVHEEGHPGRPRRRRHLGQGLARADLPVGGLDAQEIGGGGEREGEGREVDPARAIDGDGLDGGRPTVGGARDGQALDGADDRATGAPACQQALDGDRRRPWDPRR